MIEDYIIYFMMFMLLSWIFEEKVLPQLAVMVAVLIQTIYYVQNDLTILETDIYPVFLYAICLLYASLQIAMFSFEPKQEQENQK